MNYRLYMLYGLLLALPFSLRKVIWPGKNGRFSEYSDVSIYAFEVFLLGYVFLAILEHKKYIMSIIKKLFHVEQFLLLLIILYPTLVTAFFENNYFSIYLLFRWLLYIVFALFLYKDLTQNVPRGTLENKNSEKCSTWNNLRFIIIISLFFQAIFILAQVYFQKSIGLFFLGESVLNPKVNGVATIIINENEVLRGYGTFLHPNITAFFFLTYIVAYYFLSIVPRGTSSFSQNGGNCSTWNILFFPKWRQLFHVEHPLFSKMVAIVPRGTFYVIFGTILLGFFLTFSKSVLLALTIILIFYVCSTWNTSFKKLRLFHVEQFHFNKMLKIVPRGTIVLALVFILLTAFYKVDWGSYLEQSILERKIQYLSIPIENFEEVLKGSGIGMYVNKLSKKSPGLFEWQLQPIHNTYVLALFDFGFIPLITLFVYILWKRKKGPTFQLQSLNIEQKLVVVIFGMLLFLLGIDHYFWDIEQGQILFVLLVTFLVFIFRRSYPK